MARRSLRPHLNQIRTLGPPGAHRRLDRAPARGHRPADRGVQAGERPRCRTARPPRRRGVDFDDEIDLRAEDDALIAAELEAEAARGRPRSPTEDEDAEDDEDDDAAQAPRRGRRGGRSAARGARPRVARGHLRPRRGGLRPVARSRGRRQRASTPSTGRATGRRGDDRGRPDRHPPRRRRRRRRRATESRRLTRALAFERAMHARRRPRGDHRCGQAFLSPRSAAATSATTLWVDRRRATGRDADELDRRGRPAVRRRRPAATAGSSSRPPAAARLRDGLRARGLRPSTRHVYLALDGAPPRRPRAAREVGDSTTSSPPATAGCARDARRDVRPRRRPSARTSRAPTAPTGAPAPTSAASRPRRRRRVGRVGQALDATAASAQVEDVVTLRAHRGRGHGRDAIVAAALPRSRGRRTS